MNPQHIADTVGQWGPEQFGAVTSELVDLGARMGALSETALPASLEDLSSTEATEPS